MVNSKSRLTSGIVEKRAPKKNIKKNTHSKTPLPETQNIDNYSDEQPMERQVGESNAAYYQRQKTENQKKEQGAEKPQKTGIIDRGKNYANSKINEAKEYGGQKGKEAINRGVNHAKRKGSDYLTKNPKTAAALKEAREKAEAFKKKRSEDIKRLAEKKKALFARYNALKNKLNVKKQLEDKAKEIALQITKAVARFAFQAAVSVMSAIISALSEVIVIILIVVTVVAVIIYTCENTIGETFCLEVAEWL